MKRRTLLSGGTIALFSTAGCVGFLRSQFGDESDDTGESSDQQDTEDTSETNQPEGANTSPEEDESNTSENTTENEPEYAEAQDPESDTEIENTSAGDSNGTVTEPTEEDITISNAELTEGNPGTIVTGTLTNDSNDQLDTIELEATFHLEDGSSTSTMWGTNDLGAGESWEFELRADHVEYSSVVECDLRPLF